MSLQSKLLFHTPGITVFLLNAENTHSLHLLTFLLFLQGVIIAGNVSGEVVEIRKDGKVQVLVQGHAEGELWGLAVHPTAQIVATAGDDKALHIYDCQAHRPVAMKRLKKPARSAAFSPDGRTIAVGFKVGECADVKKVCLCLFFTLRLFTALQDGSFSVFEAAKLQELTKLQHRKEEISDLKFSPKVGGCQ